MINKITITKKNKTIKKGFELPLAQMTVITGKNNSGKTNFIQAVYSKKDGEFSNAEFSDEKNNKLTPSIVYIAAENIIPSDSESKSSTKKAGLVRNLSELFANLGIKLELEKPDKPIKTIKTLIDKTNENLKTFTGSDKHELKPSFNEGELESEVIIQALIKDITGSEDGEERKLDDLGQGTQRIIVASILKAYIDILIEEKIHVEKPILILFEEPEIYLHPKLKKTLNATLGEIARKNNHQVIITTHDPYFAYTNTGDEENTLYSFFIDKNGDTDKKEPGVIFGIEDELLYIHLFERVHRKAKEDGYVDSGDKKMDKNSAIDKYLRKYSGGETRDNIFPKEKKNNIALPLHVRHVIYHPLDERNTFSEADLEKSTSILSNILSR